MLTTLPPAPLLCATAAGSYLTQTPTDDGFKLVVTSQFYVPAVDTKGFLTVSLPELELTQQQELAFTGSALNAADLNKVEVKSEFAIAAGSVQLWWPAGGNYGPHKLYDVDISYAPDGHICAAPATEQPTAAVEQQQPEDEPIIRVQKPGSVARLESAFDSEFDEPISPEDAVAVLEFADFDRREAQQQLLQASSKQQRRHLLAQDAVKQILPADAAAVAAAAAAADAAPAATLEQAALAAADAPAQQNKGQVVAAAAIKGLLGAVASSWMERQAAGSSAAKISAAAAVSPQCSSIKKRIGFRTIELVMQPLPQAVQELFGGKRGFDFEIPNQKIHAILGREGGGQWANNEEGVWTNFPGDDVEVSAALCCAVVC